MSGIMTAIMAVSVAKTAYDVGKFGAKLARRAKYLKKRYAKGGSSVHKGGSRR